MSKEEQPNASAGLVERLYNAARTLDEYHNPMADIDADLMRQAAAALSRPQVEGEPFPIRRLREELVANCGDLLLSPAWAKEIVAYADSLLSALRESQQQLRDARDRGLEEGALKAFSVLLDLGYERSAKDVMEAIRSLKSTGGAND